MGSGSCGNVIAALASFFIPGLGQLLQGRLLARLGRGKISPAPGSRDPFQARLCLLLVPTDQHDLRSGACQSLRHRAAKLARPANDNCDLAGE